MRPDVGTRIGTDRNPWIICRRRSSRSTCGRKTGIRSTASSSDHHRLAGNGRISFCFPTPAWWRCQWTSCHGKSPISPPGRHRGWANLACHTGLPACLAVRETDQRPEAQPSLRRRRDGRNFCWRGAHGPRESPLAWAERSIARAASSDRLGALSWTASMYGDTKMIFSGTLSETRLLRRYAAADRAFRH